MTTGFSRYAVATGAAVVVAGALLSLAFRGPGDAQAIWLSAALAVGVQLAAFRIGRLAGENNVMARMGAGAGLRLLTLVVYGFVIAKVLGWPLAPALVSMAAFFFLTTLIDPLFIKS
jgi:hypothetical protein